MAWKFRQEFQARLGIVFDHMSTIYHSFPGRITAETFKKQILGIVEIWEDWIVFSPRVHKGAEGPIGWEGRRRKGSTEEAEGSGEDEGVRQRRRLMNPSSKPVRSSPRPKKCRWRRLGRKTERTSTGNLSWMMWMENLWTVEMWMESRWTM
jgi:U2-associated protein SR140